jgi:alpha/beta superfamily hydrolase
MASTSQLLTLTNLRGPAGRLEALLNTGSGDCPYTALVTHPHPPTGGTMHNKVVYHAMKALNAFGLPVLRFNFRGTGLSEGVHDEGRGEVDDVRSAVDWLDSEFGKPILFAGFSFGSVVGLRATCGDPRVAGLIGLGLPVRAAGRDYTYGFLSGCTQPKLFLSGDQDQFCPPDVLARILETAPPPCESFTIERTDHFFQGVPGSPHPKLYQMQAHIGAWLKTQFDIWPRDAEEPL